MDYKIRIPKLYGDVIPLHCVADAMAIAKATAFGATSFHRRAYDGVIDSIREQLLDAAKKALLQVCDQGSFPASVDDLIARARQDGSFMNATRPVVAPDWAALRKTNPKAELRPGIWDTTGIDLGESEVDEVSSVLHCLHATLKQLNDWGSSQGHSFFIDPDAPPWIDDRGVMGLPADTTPDPNVGAGVIAPSIGSSENSQQATSEVDWKTKAQAKAQELGLLRWKSGSRQITTRSICEAVATELAKDRTTWGQQGQRGADNVRSEGLRGWKFTPPKEGTTVD